MASGTESAWAALEKLPSEEVCRNADAQCTPGGDAYLLSCFRQDVLVCPSRREITAASPVASVLMGKLRYFSELAILWYLAGAKEIPPSGKLIRPSVTIGEATVTFPVEIETGCYLEFLQWPASAERGPAQLYGPQGELLKTVDPEGPLPQLKPGLNAIQFRCAAPAGLRARAYVTVVTQGEPLKQSPWQMIRQAFPF